MGNGSVQLRDSGGGPGGWVAGSYNGSGADLTVGGGTTHILNLTPQNGINLTPGSGFNEVTTLAAGGKAIFSGGQVGIGTTSPLSILTVSATSSRSNLPLLSVFAEPTLGATTTAFTVASNGNVGIGSSTPGSLLAVGGTSGINFSTGTSSFSTAGGINLANGCYAVQGTCLSGGWSLASTSVNASGLVTFKDLGSYNTILVVLNDVGSGDNVRSLQVSSDNGSTFYSSSGDYTGGSTGQTAQTAALFGQSGILTSGVSLYMRIELFNTSGPFKPVNVSSAGGSNMSGIIHRSEVLNAVQVGSSAVTGGTIYVYGLKGYSSVNPGAGAINSGLQGQLPYYAVNGSTLTATSSIFITSTNGNVGIGTTTPFRTLSVNGKVALQGLTVSTSGTPLCILANFDVVSPGGTTCALSSQFFKHNIKTISSADSLFALRPVTYNDNGDNDPRSSEDRSAYR